MNQGAFSPSLKNATSISLAAGTQFELEEVLEYLCSAVEKRYLQLRNFKLEEINDDYLFHLYRLGKMTLFQIGKERFYGKINGVDNAGKLLVERDGIQSAYGIKEIAFL